MFVRYGVDLQPEIISFVCGTPWESFSNCIRKCIHGSGASIQPQPLQEKRPQLRNQKRTFLQELFSYYCVI